MKTRRIEVIKHIIEKKSANQVNSGCSRKDGGPVFTGADLQFKKDKFNIG